MPSDRAVRWHPLTVGSLHFGILLIEHDAPARYHLAATDIQKVASFAFTLRQTRFLAKYKSGSPESQLDLLPDINKPPP
jgi:hypothetical protein